MNKEIIKKYKKEFDHWVDDGELLAKYPVTKGDWILGEVIQWKDDTAIYIINDEYVEFRKALAEGKIVENWNGSQYLDIGTSSVNFNNFYTHNLRIKPDKPKFKVGDWVIVRDNKSQDWIIMQYCREATIWKYLELWEPRDGEWCVFKYKDDDYRLAKYGSKDELDMTFNDTCYTFVAPLEFIQTLKDQ